MKLIDTQLVKLKLIIGPEDSFLYLQEPTTEPYPKIYESIPHLHSFLFITLLTGTCH
jgi:hypothetical protein